MLHRIIYLSSATEYLTQNEIVSLLTDAKSKNSQKEITGLLMYIDGDFFQIIEGEKDNVIALYEKIKKDARHKSILSIYNNLVQTRLFPDWSMGFSSTTYKEIQKLIGFESLNKKELLKIDDKTAHVFIDTFLKTHRNQIVYT